MGIFKATLKSIILFLVIVLVADVAAISIDKLLVEWRVVELRNDIADVASRNNGIPEEYIEIFEERAKSIVDRSFITQGVYTNISRPMEDTSKGITYDTLGLYEDGQATVYEVGDLMYAVVAISYSYGSLFFVVGDYWENNQEDLITIEDVAMADRDLLRYESIEFRVKEAPALRYLK